MSPKEYNSWTTNTVCFTVVGVVREGDTDYLVFDKVNLDNIDFSFNAISDGQNIEWAYTGRSNHLQYGEDSNICGAVAISIIGRSANHR